MNASPLPANAIEANGLDKVYAASGTRPPSHALKSIDLAVPRGSLFGLLGPNGAGKSTFINILAGLVLKTGGRARVWDINIDDDPRAARGAIGVVPQELNIDPFFTPRELLDLHAGLYGVPKRERRTEQILASLSLSDVADAYARTLSGGMRRRLLVGKAMVHSPPVLILDEPTAGVDIELRQHLWANVQALNEAGTTVVLTTHYLEEAEQLCDRIAIINHGRLIACEPTDQLIRRMDRKELSLTVAEVLDAVPAPLAAYGAQLGDPHTLNVAYHTRQTDIGAILAAAATAGLTIKDLSTEEPDLEDIFLELTRRTPEDAPAGARRRSG